MKNRRKFTPQFKAEVVLDVLSGASSPAELCRKHRGALHSITRTQARFFKRERVQSAGFSGVFSEKSRLFWRWASRERPDAAESAEFGAISTSKASVRCDFRLRLVRLRFGRSRSAVISSS